MFVGQLLQVKSDSRNLRIAVEAVLFPIARNLLCHPDSVHALTKWLDSEGLRADVTVKRISDGELESDEEDSIARDESILSAIEMRGDRHHPFSAYLWRWLFDSFDYDLVEVKRFKSEHGRLVTLEGLVKKDERTMRKLKRGFAFSLGWENRDRIEELSLELVKLQNERSALAQSIEASIKAQEQKEDQVRLLTEMSERAHEVAGFAEDQQRIVELQNERAHLLMAHPDHQSERAKVEALGKRAEGLERNVLTFEASLALCEKSLTQVRGLVPSREKEFKESRLYASLLEDLKSEDQLHSSLSEIQGLLEKRGVSRLQLESELNEEAQKAEQGRIRATSTAAMNLGNYRHQFNDPNLPYEMNQSVDVAALLSEWSAADKRLRETELPGARQKWKQFFDQVLMDSVKDMINEIKSRIHEIGETVLSINDVLKLTNFEDLATEQRYLRIDARTSEDERIRKFRKQMGDVEKTLGPSMRARIESQSHEVMATLTAFVDEFQKDPNYRAFVTDVRNHFQFAVQSLRRGEEMASDEVVEVFSGSRKDAKSSAQTTQLAYALLASCLAYRFHFHDPIAGSDTPRLIVFDEFGGKFDNEKPRDILKLLEKMGFQSLLVSPMSKADLLADGISHLVLVHKVSATNSKVRSYRISSRADYDRLLESMQNQNVAVVESDSARQSAYAN